MRYEERQKPLHLLCFPVTHRLSLPHPLTTNQRSYQPPLVPADISNWKNYLFQPQSFPSALPSFNNKYFFAAALPSSV